MNAVDSVRIVTSQKGFWHRIIYFWILCAAFLLVISFSMGDYQFLAYSLPIAIIFSVFFAVASFNVIDGYWFGGFLLILFLLIIGSSGGWSEELTGLAVFIYGVLGIGFVIVSSWTVRGISFLLEKMFK